MVDLECQLSLLVRDLLVGPAASEGDTVMVWSWTASAPAGQSWQQYSNYMFQLVNAAGWMML